jgi:hypothetical protein
MFEWKIRLLKVRSCRVIFARITVRGGSLRGPSIDVGGVSFRQSTLIYLFFFELPPNPMVIGEQNGMQKKQEEQFTSCERDSIVLGPAKLLNHSSSILCGDIIG